VARRPGEGGIRLSPAREKPAVPKVPPGEGPPFRGDGIQKGISVALGGCPAAYPAVLQLIPPFG